MKREILTIFDKSNIDKEYIIDSIVPFSMTTQEQDDNTVASLFFIAQLNDGSNCIIYSNYLLEEMEEEFFIENEIPFHVENNFSSFRLAANMVLTSYDAYVSNFIFNANISNIDEDKYIFSIDAVKVSGEEKSSVIFKMSSDVFAGLKYIDNYIFDMVTNNYELSTAAITAREGKEIADIVIVDKIDRIVAMAPIKDSSTCAIEFVVVSGEDKYTLLSTFDFGVNFKKRKFKGMTIDKMNSVYLNESDQYLQVFSEFCRFNNIDKEYLIIKGKNKDNINKLFIIDATSRIELESMIGEY